MSETTTENRYESWRQTSSVVSAHEGLEKLSRGCSVTGEANELLSRFLVESGQESPSRAEVTFVRIAGRYFVEDAGMWSYQHLEEGAGQKGVLPLSPHEVLVARLLFEEVPGEMTRVFGEGSLKASRCFEFFRRDDGTPFLSARGCGNWRFSTYEYWIGRVGPKREKSK